MKDGTCPKCGATAVHAKSQEGSWFRPLLTTFEAIILTLYVCTSCGYAESYVADRRQIAKIAQKWPRIHE
jgi:predicted nucleic-acid-binding Zn-ribbon protein